jgi:hypothetical protein
MPKQYDSMFESVCEKCKRKIEMTDVIRTYGMEIYHEQCFKNLIGNPTNEQTERKEKFFKGEHFNKPEHYHTHDIDTIEFLKRGFPPQVLTGFLIGNIIKYTQRFEYKNGEEDVLKIVDYAKRLQEWYKETHSS